jgi:hypothetical protein
MIISDHLFPFLRETSAMSARSALCLLALSLTAPAAVRADDDVEPVRLTLHPAASPKPSLRYRLLPDRRDLEPGNAAALYYRTEAMFVENRGLLMDLGGLHWEAWASAPLKDLPLKEVREKVGAYKYIYKELATAGRRRDCDWQLEGRPEGIGLLLPEIQGYRSLARVLVVKARLEMADGKFDQAVETLRTGYSLGRNIAQGPSVIHYLVGAAIMEMMNRRVEELIQLPGSPNLYWSLSVLPRQVADIDRLLHDELEMVERSAPWLKRLENGPLNQEQVRAAQREMDRSLESFQLPRQTYGEALRQAVQLSAVYPEARAFLKARRIGGDDLDAMPVFQAAALYAFADHREAVEEAAKWTALPEERLNHPGYWAALERWQRAYTRLDQLFFRGLLSGSASRPLELLQLVEARMARRLAVLRCLEALRLHAAAHDGKLPDSLDDVKEVPVPLDPVNGRPFRYQLDGGQAVLSAPRLVRTFGKLNAVVYQIEMKK